MAVTSNSVSNNSSPNKERKPRNSTPGIRVVSGRIYDPQHGKTCHQCRQKTMDFAVSCKNLKGAKACTIKFCYKCLFNRYGEKAEDMQLLDDWKCPKCRDICNCSFCMKRRGHKPTGILVHKAKAIGFSSVSEMLQVKGTSEIAAHSDKDSVGVSPTKLVKENSFASGNDIKILQGMSIPDSTQSKQQTLDEASDLNGDEHFSLDKGISQKPKLGVGSLDELKEKEMGAQICRDEDMLNGVKNNTGAGLDKVVQSKEKSITLPVQSVENSFGENENAAMANDVGVDVVKQKSSTVGIQNIEEDSGKCKDAILGNCVESYDAGAKPRKTSRKRKSPSSVESREHVIDIPLPEGAELTTLAGLDLPPKDAAEALQFLEFCASMGKAIGIKKAQSESLLRELFRGRPSRRGQYSQYSSIVRLHVKLLSLILEDLGEESPSSSSRGKNSWLQALGRVVSESSSVTYDIPCDCFAAGGEGYDNLDFSRKLKLLNLLCDEALQTAHLRNWIDEQNLKFVENQKEAKKKVLAAKEKKKEIKQKLQDNLAKAAAKINGAPIPISEYNSIVSQIKAEAADAHENVQKAEGRVYKNGQVSNALRTQPVILDDNGRVFWKLNSYTAEPNLLLQDLGIWGANATDEKWIAYDAGQKDAVERYIASIRIQRARMQKAAELVPDMDNETD